MQRKDRILVVDDDIKILNMVRTYLLETNYSVTTSLYSREAIKLLQKNVFDVIVVDNVMPEISGIELVQHVFETYKNIEIVVMTGVPDEATIDEFRKLGITYFIFKPFHEKQFIYTVYAAFHHIRMIQSLVSSDTLGISKNNFVGVSSLIRQIRSEIETFAKSDVPILITGETGTGKEVIANSIHIKSHRKKFPIIPVNCSTLGTLAESEFFGYVKGAFTGADHDSKGYVGSAEGGTLFLDEVSELPLFTQTKLLRFLDTGEYYPVGKNFAGKANVRIICASNSDLKSKIRQGVFRRDLYYRIAGATICAPPLRLRPEDIPHLVRYFLEIFSNMQNRTFRISLHALEAISGYSWPGNVRELKQTIYSLTQRCFDREINYTDVIHHIGPVDNELLKNYRDMKQKAIRDFDETYFARLLILSQGSLKKALEISGMHKKNFYEKLKQYGISSKLAKR